MYHISRLRQERMGGYASHVESYCTVAEDANVHLFVPWRRILQRAKSH